MDPNLFHVDWERLLEVLIAIIVLSFFLERALALIFESRAYVNKLQGKGYKEPVAFLLAFLICWRWDFDAVSIVILSESTTLLGQGITAGIIAGGSKASIKLFQELMNVKSSATREYEKANVGGGK